ncbi:Spy/CpxP family protein refolding chaperone [Bacteroidota bacterium]
MKTQRIKKTTVLAIILLMIVGTNLYAQHGRYHSERNRDFNRNQKCERIPNLTEDQENKIEALRLDHLKEVNTFKNQMNELGAKKQTLMTSDNSDLKEINAVIDKMTNLQNSMMKLKAKHHQDVRNLLTDEQKVYFDSRPMRGRGHSKGMGYHDGHGRGNRSGRGFYSNDSDPDSNN